MDDLVDFLRTTLDAAQAKAEAAGGDEWTTQDHPSDTVAIYDSRREPVVYDESLPTPEQVTHIVANDPAAVLRRIAADREIIKAHHRSGRTCPRCSLGTEDGQVVFERDPCETLRHLAEGWGWAPSA